MGQPKRGVGGREDCLSDGWGRTSPWKSALSSQNALQSLAQGHLVPSSTLGPGANHTAAFALRRNRRENQCPRKEQRQTQGLCLKSRQVILLHTRREMPWGTHQGHDARLCPQLLLESTRVRAIGLISLWRVACFSAYIPWIPSPGGWWPAASCPADGCWEVSPAVCRDLRNEPLQAQTVPSQVPAAPRYLPRPGAAEHGRHLLRTEAPSFPGVSSRVLG